MALSNRDRINQAMDQLGPALNQFLTDTIGPDLPPEFDGGWIELLRRVKSKDAHSEKQYNPDDPYDSLRMITDGITWKIQQGWDPVRQKLSRAQQSMATELMQVRNDLAHAKAFNNEDAQRALDTCSRFLLAIGAPREAEQVAKLRDDVRRIAYDRADTATRQSPKLNSGSEKLPAWREVLSPHPDVQKGQFNAAEFAADLYTVAMKSGDHKTEYTDPREFFARTYLTEGLRDLITRNVARLTGDANASPVVNLQTNFGGGKTHSMLALWHIASAARSTELGGEAGELAYALDELKKTRGIRRAALVGNQMEPASPNIADGRPGIRTMWGELAWQLGGQDAYNIVAEADRTSTNPGAALREVFELYSPAVILIDEWVAYARQLVNTSGLPAGDFDTQFTFAQTLTEAARATPGIQVVVSIPASSSTAGGDEQISDEEVGGEHGRAALDRLKSVVGRTADQWQPANAQESFEIVRRRIFSVPDAAAMSQISVIANTLVEYYRRYHSEFPSETRDPGYIDRIKQCYPIHPELFDRLYQDWSTLDRFQRTRGVLQMMNRIVGTLWREQDGSALVMPGTVPLADADVVSEVTKYLEDTFKPIINSDVAGSESVPFRVDREHELFGRRGTAQRLARATFMAATPGLHTAHKGAEKKRIFLGTALPGDVPGNFHSALDILANESTYLYTDGGRYWYDTQANTTRAARDHAAALPEADVWADVRRRLESLRKSTGDRTFTGYILCPDSSAEVLDEEGTRLVVLPLRYTHATRSGETAALTWAKDVLEHRGTANRSFKNSLVFLAADGKRAGELDSAVRNYLAWQWVADNADALGLGGQQTKQALDRRNDADEIAQTRLLETFTWGLYPTQGDSEATYSLSTTATGGAGADLFARTADKLKEELTQARSSSLIRMDLDGRLAPAWESNHVSVGQLYRYYATYPYLPRLRDRNVLLDGLYSVKDDHIGWRQDGFAFADEWDAEAGRYRGIHLPNHEGTLHISDETLIVKPEIAEEQYNREANEATAAPGGGSSDPAPGNGAAPGGGAGTDRDVVTPPPPTPSRNHRYFGSVDLDAQLPARDFNEIQQEVLTHLIKPGVQLEIRLEISAISADGFDESTERTVRENSKVLGFHPSGFEEK
ncbi:hypothetical protein GOHSU_18_01380 [Gordonia hirsuta DSM 44140 = NBRC 16056]|uniref:Swt1-like HEPN domain-containing protein n=1 Tax=Gordonia hirsuta DSM 44140 = NBRC 16056 TaxID=1121927 RepID=L7LBG4_9ACTN|nr:Swt1 family HEPN domain-containing protein [Gordonia hirsuta]GAC57383.1 hypothetical protein GOHSU_18_01380 [Gordonia hirsuta DSM 44140 = NBRC 16056]